MTHHDDKHDHALVLAVPLAAHTQAAEPPGPGCSSIQMPSPLGRIELTANSADELVGVCIQQDGLLPHDGETEHPTETLLDAAQQLSEYFDGTRTRFTVTLHEPAGTDFQRNVWHLLSTIPFGERVTYGHIARELGKPSAGRAVGAAVAANPLPLFIGCHRVLGASGNITGYGKGQGVETKRWLLNHELTVPKRSDDTPPTAQHVTADQPRLPATTSSTTSSSSPVAP